MISFDQVSFGYRARQPLFENLNLELPSGQIYGLLGKNGAGKSSLLRLVQGLLYAQRGQIEVLNQNPSERQPALLSEIFRLGEDFYLPNMKIERYLKNYAPFYPKFDRSQFYTYLYEFEVEKNAHLKQLSSGQKKKVLLSFALACNTQILLLDEPTNALDIPSKRQFRRLISDLISYDRIIIISSHQIRDLHSLLDSIIILDQGKIIFQHSMMEIMEHLNFQVTPYPPNEYEVLYCERVPGGYMTLQPNLGIEDSLEADLEILFNAVTSFPEEIEHLFTKENHHAQ
ncbi:MAG: ABC transporter ATP-binding protein [Bacteroidota bacterium]